MHRVDHSHLFCAFKAFGIGDGFLAWVSLLYRDAQCMVKGCPISDQLYSLAIKIWALPRLSGLSLTGTFKPDRGLPTLSAYADDISSFVSNQGDIQTLKDTLSLYKKVTLHR